MSVDEQLIIFLTIVCQTESNRETQHQWQYSGATISKYFMVVLNAIFRLRHDFIKPPDFNRIDPLIEASGNKYRPWFDVRHISSFFLLRILHYDNTIF